MIPEKAEVLSSKGSRILIMTGLFPCVQATLPNRLFAEGESLWTSSTSDSKAEMWLVLGICANNHLHQSCSPSLWSSHSSSAIAHTNMDLLFYFAQKHPPSYSTPLLVLPCTLQSITTHNSSSTLENCIKISTPTQFLHK